MSGWIKVHRSIRDHWIAAKPEYLAAWVRLLLEVNHEPKKVCIGNKIFECGTGESLRSIDSWASLFGRGWTRQKVRTFFRLLESDSMINQMSVRKTTRITICNWDTYQTQQPSENHVITRAQPELNQSLTTNKNEKNERSIRKSNTSAPDESGKGTDKSDKKKKPFEELPATKRMTFDYETGNLSGILEKDIEKWKEAYPAVDVGSEILKAKMWLDSNPKNRKSNIYRFLTNWLSRKQEKGGTRGYVSQNNQPQQEAPKTESYHDRLLREAEAQNDLFSQQGVGRGC